MTFTFAAPNEFSAKILLIPTVLFQTEGRYDL